MRKWKRVETADGPRFRSELEPPEALLLTNMVTSVLEMLDEREAEAPADELESLTGIRTGNPEPPEDATMSRLLPDFYRTDPPNGGDPDAHPADLTPQDFNAALRSMHEPDIIDAKRDAATTMRDSIPEGGGRLELTEQDAHAWAAAVNDVRLALGEMLQIGPEGLDLLPPDHPLAGHLDVYHWLTALQEYLVMCLMGKRA
ncbi:oxidative stress transcriptional regulator AosR [Mycolicibacterium brumae]|uniref:DUF2017 domain-containing protein n=1 Tax=Mycolicibacterium brumae TaxID=85968 RepID=A0A2G5P964_9MYCO|nr:DUF2017 domain-containing protein [Mycolicibacterium brumae]MCV7193947.1 DUF2017 domain-containing protein [Mycolicibacterium brumae]PIB74901.1 DUF2017 domain-containing protein [Mycolicibacterium brumae]RWA22478.1 hypothetical protein MBRU_12920 [Mycolicibacterium brumae DSM 44177]UWW07995.1 DUF2017 domain-containing protein [Mycolicibacterium brumae]